MMPKFSAHIVATDLPPWINLLFEAGRPIRRLFLLPPSVWRHAGVIRQDLQDNTRMARQAKAVYENLKIPGIPDEVLQGTLRAVYGPKHRERNAKLRQPAMTVRHKKPRPSSASRNGHRNNLKGARQWQG